MFASEDPIGETPPSHIFYSSPALNSSRQPTDSSNPQPTTQPSTLRLSDIQNIAAHVQPPKIPFQRSHDPSNTLKRTDPFQFGTRYLQDTDEVLSYNAWDNGKPSLSSPHFHPPTPHLLISPPLQSTPQPTPSTQATAPHNTPYNAHTASRTTTATASTPRPRNGGTSSTATTRAIFSRIANGYGRSFPS